MKQKMNQFCLKFMSHILTMTLMTDLEVQTLLRTFGMETMYIQKSTQYMLD